MDHRFLAAMTKRRMANFEEKAANRIELYLEKIAELKEELQKRQR